MPTFIRGSVKRCDLQVASGDRTVLAGDRFPFGVRECVHLESGILNRLKSARLWKKIRLRSFGRCISLEVVIPACYSRPNCFRSVLRTPRHTESREAARSRRLISTWGLLYPAVRRQEVFFTSKLYVRLPGFPNLCHPLGTNVYILIQHTHTHTRAIM